METIYQRDNATVHEGGADFHAANQNLIPEWLIVAMRESKEAAKTIEVAAREINQQSGADVFAPMRFERPATDDERYVSIIKASSELLVGFRDEEIGERAA